MGLFRRGGRAKASAQPDARPAPIEIDEAAIALVAARLGDIEQAVGTSDAPLREAIRAFAETGGTINPDEWHKNVTGVQQSLVRPWFWLAGAASHATAQGNDLLAARAFLFTSFFVGLQPNLGLADYMDMWIDPAPPDARAEIATAALMSLRRLPDEQQVTPLAAEDIRVAPLRTAAAQELTSLHREGAEIGPDALAAAQEVLA